MGSVNGISVYDTCQSQVVLVKHRHVSLSGVDVSLELGFAILGSSEIDAKSVNLFC